MTKRTLDLKYLAKDIARNTPRNLMSFEHNLDKISYEEKSDAPAKQQNDHVLQPREPELPAPIVNTLTNHPPVVAAVTEFEDAPVTVVEIISTLIAIGLKKPLDELQMSESIKALSKGRSTLQNEILGDLAAELGDLPAGAEDLPLETLCSTFKDKFSGKCGKKSSTLIEKMLSSKFPRSLQITAIRKYLQTKWGLGPGRQDSVLLWAVTSQPDFRLTEEEEAKVFVDGIVKLYVKSANLVIPTASSIIATSDAQALLDPEALNFIENRQNSIFEQQIRLYANILGVDLQAADTIEQNLSIRIAQLEKELNMWNMEHGEIYASGIKPIFSPTKVRQYDSWWNWVMQDLLILVHGLDSGTSERHQTSLTAIKQRLVNRSSSRLLETMRFLKSKAGNNQTRDTLRDLIHQCENDHEAPPRIYRDTISMAPRTVLDSTGKITYTEVKRAEATGASDADLSLRLGRRGLDGWQFEEGLTSNFLTALQNSSSKGFSFSNKNVLITGAGEGSIGAAIVKSLLSAGATVIVTSSSYSPKVTRYHQNMYAEFGVRGSKLLLVPFNQASQQDVESLVSFIYAADGLNIDLDFVVPFAAMSEAGNGLSTLDSKSELSHRLMLTHTLRLIGAIKRQKEDRGITTRPANVILPLSPNHGAFGYDGLYAESKIALETAFEKWHSEDWADYLTICGAIIGWTRGTGLMSNNDIVSEGMESHGLRTFARDEMAFNILALMSSDIVPLSVSEPLVADLSGGLGTIKNLKDMTTNIRESMTRRSDELRAIAKEEALESHEPEVEEALEEKANFDCNFPKLPDYQSEIQPLTRSLRGMVDLDRVVVITGFAEVGPYGSSRVRWDMEANGRLSLTSCVELAWTMGLIKAHSGMIDGQPFAGWLDKETSKPISDARVKEKYEQYLLQNSGIRLMESKSADSPWDSNEILHEIEIESDQPPFEASDAIATQLKKAHGEKVQITRVPDSEQCKIILKKGARMLIPKSVNTSHTVGGQVPKGWDARTFGVPEEIIAQVDPATLYALVCAAEALYSAGLSDAFELYQHIHVSDVGNCVGAGLGGVTSLRSMFRSRYQDKVVANDVLAETFINSGSAWINMLLLSASGPIKTPVGACATAVESLDTGYDLITTGKAKLCIVGGFDDMIKETADEFASIKATIDPSKDIEGGRDPREMSRPATSTRNGFVESEGAGMQVITSASLALEIGLPIYGIVAFTQTASDKIGRSLPAPGRGVLSNAAQAKAKFEPPLMNMMYRRRNIEMRKAQARETRDLANLYLEEQIEEMRLDGHEHDIEEYRRQRISEIENDANRDVKEALNQYGNHFWIHDNHIAPMKGALAVWGLTVDDIDVVSFHGTSTKANEKNESTVLQTQFAHLGRTKGNAVPGVFQKYLTGHPKGPAGAWMINGCLKSLETGLIPGNLNADDIDPILGDFDYLVYPNRSIQTAGVRAFSVTSFGFGQKGAQMIGVHPKYLYATLEPELFQTYQEKVGARKRKAARKFQEGIFNNKLFVAKDTPPYEAEQEMKFLLDPQSRLPGSDYVIV